MSTDSRALDTVPGTTRLSLTFRAFHESNVRAWLRYAHLHLGDRQAAEHAVDASFAHLARVWTDTLREASAQASAWNILKHHVRVSAHQGRTALVEIAAFSAVGGALRHAHCRFEIMESALGLYSAVARLPDRPYDTLVLCCVLGYTEGYTARLLGIREATVRSNLNWARRRLAKELGMTDPEDIL